MASEEGLIFNEVKRQRREFEEEQMRSQEREGAGG